MTVQRVTSVSHFTGLSTDAKPFPAGGTDHDDANMPPGSTFYETDTRRRFTWDGGAWVPDADLADVVGVLERLDHKLGVLVESNQVIADNV